VTFGLDARAAAEVPAGRGRYVRELLAALAADGEQDRYRLYARRAHRSDLPAGRFDWELSGLRDPLWHLAAARRASRATSAFLSTNSYLTAWATTVPTAVVVYDMVAFLPDGHAQARAARIERATIRPALRRTAALLCISEATRRDLVRLFPRAEPIASVIPLAADARFGEPVEPARLERPYVLAVGTLEPRKNLVRLVAAFAALPDELRASHQLALVGPEGWDMDEILRAAAASPEDVTLLGHVDEDRLHALYAGAACFAYPSLYEGFGLPVLEAMAAGAPVVTSTVSSLPEVAGNAGLLADPRDVRSIRDALAAVLGDPARAAALRAAGRERAAGFSWARTAAATRDVLRELAHATRS
jgi:glycosyltransferase involved in cell wall biosynthesis